MKEDSLRDPPLSACVLTAAMQRSMWPTDRCLAAEHRARELRAMRNRRHTQPQSRGVQHGGGCRMLRQSRYVARQ
ncbi:hypothetical protein DQG23_25905 [Paenibacillus contaminans]|uniref:Uncharacterized protein n=1 Tax=Paenibacillus contaminans TaxID=450362 RepID=A0A329MDX2_9BACL|nr:hypothetical protein DQG23_25905 [Paenibacillus contaminans]